jgi:hypothetical protein
MNNPLMYPDYPVAIVIYIVVLENKGRETYRKKVSMEPPPTKGVFWVLKSDSILPIAVP